MKYAFTCMKPSALSALFVVGCLASASPLTADVPAANAASVDELVGLWKAQQWFGPQARGALILERASGGWTADFFGRILPVRSAGAQLTFELPNGEGAFAGKLRSDGTIGGHWTAPRSRVHGFRYATPVLLSAEGADRWRGTVAPFDDEFTLYLKVQKRPDGVVSAFLRNPERNIGVFFDVDRVTRDGPAVRLIGRRRGETAQVVLLEGRYEAESAIPSIAMPERGGTYDFRREEEQFSDFHARGRNAGRYAYRPPPPRDDGWLTATLADVAIDRAAIERFIQMIIDQPIESVHSPEVQGILIARHGKLVLEEYFHGEHRDKLHDTRSAAKSLTTTLIGAAINDGALLKLSTPVYQAMNALAAVGQEPRKRDMTLEHLLTMRSGYFCDDSNLAAPGREDTMLDQQDEPDYYRYTLRLPLDRKPGERGVYCSIDPNLALGVLSRATGEPVLDTFDRLLARPLQIHRYAWPLSPAGQPYGGGGVRFLPRDFMKLGQLMLGGGTWQGRRILGAEFSARASAPLHDLNAIQYGLLWWNIEYPYEDRTLRAYFAGGNGGQVVMVVPDLDLVIATYGGNYGDRVGLQIQQEYVPNYILPAVRESGDDPNAPVAPREFETPYGR